MIEQKYLVRAYFNREKHDNKVVTRRDAKVALKEDFAEFAAFATKIRNGYIEKGQDGQSLEIKGRKASLSELVKARYGETVSKKDYLEMIGIFDNMSLTEASIALGASVNMSVKEFREMISFYTASSFASTKDYDKNYRFFIPELIIDAGDLAYRGAGISKNWIAFDRPRSHVCRFSVE